MTITNVGVVGCGLMGSGIVQVAAQAGCQVLFVEANDELVKRGLGRLHETLEGLVSKGKLDRICPPSTILASNTSSCNVTAMAAATGRPGLVLGLHFFNPVPLMKLVEVVRTILTDDPAVKTAIEWVRALGKTPVQTKDSTAFIVNRLLVPYLLDAIRVYESGLASLEDIDQAMKLGCGYPMGPFTLLDLVGLDTT